MKIIALLFAILIVSSMGGIVNRKKSFGRTSTPEEINFQLLFLGTCNDFNSIPKVTVSSLSTGGCLPINPTSPFAATDDLTADVLCTNIGRNRAQIDFVEIYNGTEATPYTGGFAISFVPNKPFKANGQVSYLRRPSCTTQKDFCSTTTYVHSCTENPAVTKNGFVISNDEIFIVSNHLSAVGCGQAINSCCGYLSALCPRTAPNTLLKFNWDEHKYNSYNDHHEEHHENNHHDDDDYKHGHGNQQGHGNQGHGNQGHGNQGHGNQHPPQHGNQHPPQHGNQHPPQNSYAQNNNQHKSEEDNNTHKIVFDDEEDDKKKK